MRLVPANYGTAITARIRMERQPDNPMKPGKSLKKSRKKEQSRCKNDKIRKKSGKNFDNPLKNSIFAVRNRRRFGFHIINIYKET